MVEASVRSGAAPITRAKFAALAAECLGTALLVGTVVGSGIMAERLAGGNIAVALLANTMATAAMLFVLITVFGPVSGAHFNPAVTLVFYLRREIGGSDALAFAALQIIGGALGAMLANLMFDLPVVHLSHHLRTGPSQWLSEFIATFSLVMTILGTLRVNPRAVPLVVALVIAAAYWFTASTSFANPAVTIARMLSDTFAGIAPSSVPTFIVAQIVGALAALGVAQQVFGWRATS
jgi:glycerol uptake facilitator-like aquaporin